MRVSLEARWRVLRVEVACRKPSGNSSVFKDGGLPSSELYLSYNSHMLKGK